jgi:hypothetical protein
MEVLDIIFLLYAVGVVAAILKSSNQAANHPELDNPVYAIGGFIASFGSWFTYFWMRKQDKNNGR